MDEPIFRPHEFQRCTANWVADRLFGKTSRAPAGRVLVADEVGLGKTIVTKHVCDKMRTLHPVKNLQIVYMASSLDICRQNRKKLSLSVKELVTADRITLLHAYKRIGTTPRVTIVSMTPGTSIQISNSAGNTAERLYIAWLARKLFHFGRKQACRVFALDAPRGFPEKFCKDTFSRYRRPPGSCWRALKPVWRNLRVGGERVSDLTHDRRIDKATARLVVKKLRSSLVEALLGNFNPDLIILDEFQRFKEVLALKEGGGLEDRLTSLLLKPSTPTLLLSATPYRLWDDGAQVGNGSARHQADLQDTFAFLFDSPAFAEDLTKRLERLGLELKTLGKEKVPGYCQKKEQIEKTVKRVMARTERVNYLAKGSNLFQERFLTSSSHALSPEELYEFLALSRSSASRRTLLSYWKSGSSLLSMMHDYQLRAQWLADRRTRGNKRLWARFRKTPPSNIKVRYLLADIFGKDGKGFQYLWIPPTHTYYPGNGVFDQERLKSQAIKKGLVFSTWQFVPRFIAAETNHRRQYKFRRIKPKINPLRATPVTWARFYFPSPFLSRILSHSDFVRAGNLRNLLTKAAERIRKQLDKDFGIKECTSATSKPWQVLRYVDFRARGDLQPALGAYRKLYGQGEGNTRRGRAYEDRYLRVWEEYEARPKVSRRTIDALARMAVGSPSICLLRTLTSLHVELSPHGWSELLEFCIHDVRNYLNRSANHAVISSSFPKGTYADRVEVYLTAGNFQALLDEYLSVCDVGSEDGPVLDSIALLRTVLSGGASGSVSVPVNSRGKKVRITTDIAVAFGEGKEASASRDSIRIGFNSPFWPMVLATTSVGQEGLDFHLYCKDVYHWNLPNNPVAFEQREGRINRFNNLMVRRNLVANQPCPKIIDGTNLWQRYFEEAPRYCVANDRYNLGLSPHWIYTPRNARQDTTFQRHILDLPHSADRGRYELLMTDLTNYRLALGQPDPAEFLKTVRDNPYLKTVDVRGLTLNFFPEEHHRPEETISFGPNRLRELKQLMQDATAYLKSAAGCPGHRQLGLAVKECLRQLRDCISASGQKDPKLVRGVARAAKALRSFLDPHDAKNDRIPEIGFADDMEVLRKALAFCSDQRRATRERGFVRGKLGRAPMAERLHSVHLRRTSVAE